MAGNLSQIERMALTVPESLAASCRKAPERVARLERLAREGLQFFTELPRTATDLHAGNVVRARREPWLVIDPKPFIGDAAHDATQHLLNCEARLFPDRERTIRHFADLLAVDHERV